MLFIISIAIAVWMYKDMEVRKENGALWLIIELLFPYIGLIIWLIVRPPEPSFYEKKAG
ncbi:MAG: PLDc N-terminal domain-containing protein [Candidatus Thermoplasmatota archaeon]|nr:PLDc N-terminal domain-containing protein [Candidatus Thermoplasmatota archaeon]